MPLNLGLLASVQQPLLGFRVLPDAHTVIWAQHLGCMLLGRLRQQVTLQVLGAPGPLPYVLLQMRKLLNCTVSLQLQLGLEKCAGVGLDKAVCEDTVVCSEVS